jgi:hypothetical protein
VARRLGYEPEEAAQSVKWTPEGEQRLARVPAFEREMVRSMAESLARAEGHSVIDYAAADAVLGKIRGYYEAAMRGGEAFFSDMAAARQAVEEQARLDGYELGETT